MSIMRDPNIQPSKQAANELERSSSEAISTSASKSEQTVEYLIKRERGFLESLFPGEVDQAIAKGQLDLVKTEFEFRVQALSVVRETQLQSLKEICNIYLAKGRAGSRADLGDFLTQKRVELETQIQAHWDDFQRIVEEQYQKNQAIQMPVLKQTAMDRLNESIIGFSNMVRNLVKDFEQIAASESKV